MSKMKWLRLSILTASLSISDATTRTRVPNVPAGVRTPHPVPPQHSRLPERIDSSGAVGFTARPQVLPYDPVADPAAVVIASDNDARFTVLTPRLIRMEYATQHAFFEDRATLAVLNRQLPVPSFTKGEAGGILTITTSEVKLQYKVGAGFTAASLSVTPVNASSTFPGWTYGQDAPGNLLGTSKSPVRRSLVPTPNHGPRHTRHDPITY